MTVTVEDIQKARTVLKGQIVETPTVFASRLSGDLGCTLYLKLESMQHTGSFKDRGAFNKINSLTEAQRKKGIVTMSAGNHAQGVAWHAQRLGIPATIVMPETTPSVKIANTASYGATIVLHGDNINTAEPRAKEIEKTEERSFVHPYADPLIIAGQGTVGLELLEAVPDLDTILVPIGGGGIISGIAIAAKSIKPDIQIIGVEAKLYPSMYQLLNNLPPEMGGNTIAEGIAVKAPGEINVEIVRKLVDDIILLDETALERGICTLVERARIVAEGAGAASLSALLAHPERFRNKKIATVICGANIDTRILSSVLSRGMIQTGRLCHLRICILDMPGALAQISSVIAGEGANIIDVIHHRLFQYLPAKQAELDMVIETRNHDHIEAIKIKLSKAGFECRVQNMQTTPDGRE